MCIKCDNYWYKNVDNNNENTCKLNNDWECKNSTKYFIYYKEYLK